MSPKKKKEPMAFTLLKNASQIVSPKPGVMRGPGLKELQVFHDASVLIADGTIQAVGSCSELEKLITDQTEIIDLAGKTIMPGFVDSHTHLVFGGSRESEFARRVAGASYEEIASQGGGIQSTVKATREISRRALTEKSLLNLKKAVRHGTTSMEIKSGYGLNEETELKMLEVINDLKNLQPLELTATFLGAHAVPPETSKSEYIRRVIEMMPKAARLASYCDVFCEKGYFSASETREILQAASLAGLKPRIHINQFNDIGGIQVAIEVGAASVDHLEVFPEKDIQRLAETDICATMLPGVSLFLNIDYPLGRKIVDNGCIPVLATDFNPGSSMTLNMPLVLSLACTQMGLSMEEAMAAATQNAAFSLGMEKLGCIEPGWQADLIVLDSDNYQNLIYFFAEPMIEKVFKKGQLIWDRNAAWG
jgi:imidazolonepropionase